MKIYHKKTKKLILNIFDIKTDLIGANLEGANLKGANLEGANLQGTFLQKADLRNTNLEGANLQCTDFINANLKGTKFQGANLQDAKLDTPILFFKFYSDILQKIGDEIRIKDEVHNGKYWLKHGKKILKKFGYSVNGIETYLEFIRKNC